jgi:DDE superfamily endonuclease
MGGHLAALSGAATTTSTTAPSLFAAFNIADGTVISELHRRHRVTEFRKFLVRIDRPCPPGWTCTWSATTWPPTRPPLSRTGWPATPGFHLHFTPAGSSWINQVERWFGYLTDQMIRRGVHKSVQAMTSHGSPRDGADRVVATKSGTVHGMLDRPGRR